MELTVGTALQGSKYVIQKVLRQSDIEVMYQAVHTYLDQPVLLRSLNPACQQRDDFAQVKQQFVADVRSQAKQSMPSAAPILDCFEEDELPFVVLQFQPQQFASNHPAEASDSPAALPLPTPPTEEIPSEKNIPARTTNPDLVQAFDAAFNASAEQHPTDSNLPGNSQPASNGVTRRDTREPIGFQPIPSLDTADATAVNGHSQTGSARSSRQRFQKIPIALLAVSLVGGCIGVGTGLALRFDAAQSQAGNKPRLSLFNREQSFPSEGNWPIQERYSPEPAIEQPLYRATPAPDYTPSIQPLPATPIPPPDSSVENTKPLPEPFALPEDSASSPANPQPKLPVESAPLPEQGASTVPPTRLQPISPDNLLPPNATPAPLPPPAAHDPVVEPPALKTLPHSSGI